MPVGRVIGKNQAETDFVDGRKYPISSRCCHLGHITGMNSRFAVCRMTNGTDSEVKLSPSFIIVLRATRIDG
jgi:hypothetical protein